ncbi:MAG: hypothetical protein ACXVHX_34350 [Solirubrobacteraceae bacterium]
MHLHKWSKWAATDHYTDVSWGGRAASTTLTRRCLRCGFVKSKGLYGVYIPLDEEAR